MAGQELPADVLARLQAALAQQGLDVAQPFNVQSYNDAVKSKPVIPQLPDFGRGATAAICVGNSKLLWPAFIQHLSSNAEFLSQQHPLDAFVHLSVQRALRAALSQPDCRRAVDSEVRFSDGAGEEFVDMLAAARVSGVAYQDPDIHLCISPQYGPWLALRAVIVLDMDMPDVPALHAAPVAAHPFPETREACKALMDDIMAHGGWGAASNRAKFVQLRRMAAPAAVLQAHGYSDAQIEYHYTKSKDVLAREVQAGRS